MKKLVLTLCLIIPFIGFSQKVKWLEKERFNVQFRLGSVYDHYAQNKDAHSPDLSSNYENDITLNSSASLYYTLSSNLSLGIDIGHGKIYGENELQYYQGDFEELNFNAKLNFLTYNKLELYGRVSTGVIRYQSQRNFLKNDFPISEAEGEALKSSLALGVEYRFKRQWLVLFDASFNRVDNDNFDAWDDGLGNSKYLVTSIGLKYNLVAPSSNKKDEIIDNKKEIKRRVKANYDTNVEPRLQEIENQIASHSHQINKEDLIIESNETKTKHQFFFETNEHLVSINSLERVVDIADIMKANSAYKANITGYADSDASTILNEMLSKKRAENIKKYLVSLGLEGSRISTFYKGEASPLAPNDSQLNKQLNRRVDIVLVN
jgi:outer membrane protein OmpA-like peptidoglycan-associated protein